MEEIFQKWKMFAKVPTRSEWEMWQIEQLERDALEGIKTGWVNEQSCIEIINSFYKLDLKTHLKKDKISVALANDMKVITNGEKKHYWFVTVNFDDSIITIPDIKRTLVSLGKIANMELRAIVAEKYRKDNTGSIYEHHHIHAVYVTDYPKQKTIQYIFQKVQKLVQSKNFIDVKNEQPIENYIKYISGEKQASKLECIELDKNWRALNNL